MFAVQWLIRYHVQLLLSPSSKACPIYLTVPQLLVLLLLSWGNPEVIILSDFPLFTEKAVAPRKAEAQADPAILYLSLMGARLDQLPF